MNFKGLILALAAGLSISTAAQAGVTVHNSDFLGATGNSNGFEAIGGTFYNGSAGYTEGGVKVQYVGLDLDHPDHPEPGRQAQLDTCGRRPRLH